jgi:soluble lytic murein transglycosylase-like protein
MIGHPPPGVVSDASPAGLTEPSVPAATEEAECSTPTASKGHNSNVHKLIERIAEEYGIDPYLVKGVVRVESNFNAKAKSRSGACGLMQLMPDTARRLGVDNIFDPADNLRGGVKYLSRLIDRFGNVRAALAAYLRGPKAILKHGGVPHDSATRKFIRRVLGYRDAYLYESPREQVFAETPAPDELKRP